MVIIKWVITLTKSLNTRMFLTVILTAVGTFKLSMLQRQRLLYLLSPLFPGYFLMGNNHKKKEISANGLFLGRLHLMVVRIRIRIRMVSFVRRIWHFGWLVWWVSSFGKRKSNIYSALSSISFRRRDDWMVGGRGARRRIVYFCHFRFN